MLFSRLLIPTLKETPAEAEAVSHRLLLRAGMIRKLASGIYNYLPLGLRVLRKVEHIVREEMNRAGAQEVLLPAVQPAELWQETGRWQIYGKELLRFKDRHGRGDYTALPTLLTYNRENVVNMETLMERAFTLAEARLVGRRGLT